MSKAVESISDAVLTDLEAQVARVMAGKESSLRLSPATVAAVIVRLRAAEARVASLLPRPLPGFEEVER